MTYNRYMGMPQGMLLNNFNLGLPTGDLFQVPGMTGDIANGWQARRDADLLRQGIVPGGHFGSSVSTVGGPAPDLPMRNPYEAAAPPSGNPYEAAAPHGNPYAAAAPPQQNGSWGSGRFYDLPSIQSWNGGRPDINYGGNGAIASINGSFAPRYDLGNGQDSFRRSDYEAAQPPPAPRGDWTANDQIKEFPGGWTRGTNPLDSSPYARGFLDDSTPKGPSWGGSPINGGAMSSDARQGNAPTPPGLQQQAAAPGGHFGIPASPYNMSPDEAEADLQRFMSRDNQPRGLSAADMQGSLSALSASAAQPLYQMAGKVDPWSGNIYGAAGPNNVFNDASGDLGSRYQYMPRTFTPNYSMAEGLRMGAALGGTDLDRGISYGEE